jgi:hypothetical protein
MKLFQSIESNSWPSSNVFERIIRYISISQFEFFSEFREYVTHDFYIWEDHSLYFLLAC